MLAATAGYERAVLTLRVATQHRRRQAPRRRRRRRDAHLAEAAPHPPQTEPEAARRPAGQPHPARPQRLTAEHPQHHPDLPHDHFPRPHEATSTVAAYSLSQRTD